MKRAWSTVGTVLVLLIVGVMVDSAPTSSAVKQDATNAGSELETVIANTTLPPIEEPKWLKEQIAKEEAAAKQGARRAESTIVVNYTVATRGATSSDITTFRAQAGETLNHARGWARMNIKFVEVASGGQFTLFLSQASQVPSFSSGCSAQYSCRVGTSIIINDDRWSGATPAWNNAGGGLRDYRHMVINHEVGHWLGHGHPGCSGAGQVAPVMLQQSIDLQGCTFNPWPLASELYSGTLGI